MKVCSNSGKDYHMLKNTGERLILEQSWNLMTTLEHLHRYNAVSKIVKDKIVLDAACGTGYGSAILSCQAKFVHGIDLNQDAIEYAKLHYQNNRINYQQMSITELDYPDDFFDVIVSFETIEHITKECQSQFLKQIIKKLKPNGILIISTPNDQLMRDMSYGSYFNPYHLCEFSQEEFEIFLNQYFKNIQLYYQTVTEVSAIVPQGKITRSGEIYSMEDNNSMGRYYIAICSNTNFQQELSLESCLLPKPEQYFDEKYFTKTARLFIDTGKGFNGEEQIEEKYLSRDNCSFEVKFSLDGWNSIKNIRFDPCEHGAEIEITSLNSNLPDLTLIAMNAKKTEGSVEIFMTLDPIYLLVSENLSQLSFVEIKGKIKEIPMPDVLADYEKQKMQMTVAMENLSENQERLEEKNRELLASLENEKQGSEKRAENINYLLNVVKQREDKIVFLEESQNKSSKNIEYLSQKLDSQKKGFEETLHSVSNELELAKSEIINLKEESQQLFQTNLALKESQKKLELQKEKQEEWLRNLSLENAQKENNIQNLMNQIEQQEEQMQGYVYQLQCLEQEKNIYKLKAMDIENSTFWKITWPARKICDILRFYASNSKLKALPIRSRGFQTEKENSKVYEPEWYEWLYDEPIKEHIQPLVSVVVPNYNHASYLRERLDSIYHQTYSNIEVILLDDCSTDNSRDILNEYAAAYPQKTRLAFSTKNEGQVLKQWNKGLELAKGKYVWIAESDDYCELNFLETLVPLLEYQSVMLAFSRSTFMQDGVQIWTSEEYCQDIAEINWKKSFTATAQIIVKLAFARKNIIPNVSSAIFRNIGKLPDDVCDMWQNHDIKLSGDWLFYLSLIKGGCISYSVDTTNYYRVHQNSTSLKIQRTPAYYHDFEEVAKYIVRNYKVDTNIFEIVQGNLIEHYKAIHHTDDAKAAIVKDYYDLNKIANEKTKRKPNILMACFSMKMGGGETFPLYLAAEMKRQGLSVTVIDFRMDKYDGKVREMLPISVPLVEVKSPDYLYQIIFQLNGEIIHSHHASVDEAIATWLLNSDLDCKQIISLHGMYEAISEKDCKITLNKVCRSCSYFIYTAEKNLECLKKYGYYDKVKLAKIMNGLPEQKINCLNREDFKIPQNAFVLCLVSRAIPEKGWEEAVNAVLAANQESAREIHLILIGDGESKQKLSSINSKFIHFMGAQNNIRDYFSISDVGFLPSRFLGESVPLVVIDSLMCNKPVIATDLGEIKNQLKDKNGELAGELLHLNNWKLNINEIKSVILKLSNNQNYYKVLEDRTKSAAQKFNISKVAEKYLEIYLKVFSTAR